MLTKPLAPPIGIRSQVIAKVRLSVHRAFKAGDWPRRRRALAILERLNERMRETANA